MCLIFAQLHPRHFFLQFFCEHLLSTVQLVLEEFLHLLAVVHIDIALLFGDLPLIMAGPIHINRYPDVTLVREVRYVSFLVDWYAVGVRVRVNLWHFVVYRVGRLG